MLHGRCYDVNIRFWRRFNVHTVLVFTSPSFNFAMHLLTLFATLLRLAYLNAKFNTIACGKQTGHIKVTDA